jgi:hypothetical protein
MITASLDIVTGNAAEFTSAIVGLSEQLPYAYSLAANQTINDAQKAIQATLPERFILRRADFISHTIYRKPGQDFATKTNLVAAVRVNPDRDFLAKFEDGGQKTSTTGKSLAVPIFREDDPRIIIGRGDPLSVQKLFDAIATRKGHTFKGRKKRGQPGPQQINFGRVFIAKNEKGTFILERQSSGSGGTRVLYWFRKSVPIKDQLHFDDTAMAAALEHWEENLYAAIDRAIGTSR